MNKVKWKKPGAVTDDGKYLWLCIGRAPGLPTLARRAWAALGKYLGRKKDHQAGRYGSLEGVGRGIRRHR